MMRGKVVLSSILMWPILSAATIQQQHLQAATVASEVHNDGVSNDSMIVKMLSTSISSGRLVATNKDNNAVAVALHNPILTPRMPVSLNRQGLLDSIPIPNPSFVLSGIPLSTKKSHRSEPLHFVPIMRRPSDQTNSSAPKTPKIGNANSFQTTPDVTQIQTIIKLLETMIDGTVKNALPIPEVNGGVPLPIKSSLKLTQTPNLPSAPSVADLVRSIAIPIKMPNSVPTTPPSTVLINDVSNNNQTQSNVTGLETIKNVLETMVSDPVKNTLLTPIENIGVQSPLISRSLPPESFDTHSGVPLSNLGSTLGIGGVPLSATFPTDSNIGSTLVNHGVPLLATSSSLSPEDNTPHSAQAVGNLGSSTITAGEIPTFDSNDLQMLRTLLDTMSRLPIRHDIPNPLGSNIDPSGVPIDNLDLSISEFIQNSDVTIPNISSLPLSEIKEDLKVNTPGIQLPISLGTSDFILRQQQTGIESLDDKPFGASNILSNTGTPSVKALRPPTAGPITPVQSTSYDSNVNQPYFSSAYGHSHHGGFPPRHYQIRVRRPRQNKSKEKDMNYFYEKIKSWFDKDDKRDSKKESYIPQSHYVPYPHYYPSGSYGIPPLYENPLHSTTPQYDSGIEYWGYGFAVEGLNGEIFDDVRGASGINRGPGVTLPDETRGGIRGRSISTRSTDSLDGVSDNENSEIESSSVNRGLGVSHPDLIEESVGGSITLKWLSW